MSKLDTKIILVFNVAVILSLSRIFKIICTHIFANFLFWCESKEVLKVMIYRILMNCSDDASLKKLELYFLIVFWSIFPSFLTSEHDTNHFYASNSERINSIKWILCFYWQWKERSILRNLCFSESFSFSFYFHISATVSVRSRQESPRSNILSDFLLECFKQYFISSNSNFW